jgi:exodeoxyribonuclease VII small subunit
MEKRSFEENLGILESLVKDLENGNINLDDAISKYTEAMNIAKDCSTQINNATESVNKILNENGTLNDFNIKEGE